MLGVWDVTTLERTFERAKTGKFRSVAGTAKKINPEDFQTEQITGRSLGAQLRDLIRIARQTDT